MSWQDSESPKCNNPESNPVVTVITPRERDIGEFTVRRALPAASCRSVGPFVFFDQMGPVVLEKDQAMDVRPHPHIGLSTITWLFEGEIRHRDSLGMDLVIRPGEVNWMTAGKGIVHSERSPDSARQVAAPLSGIQAWMALPADQEEIEPAFYHYSADKIPRLNLPGIQLALIAGAAWGLESAVQTQSPTFYAELRMQTAAKLEIPADIPQRAIYICSGSINIAELNYAAGCMVVLKPGMAVTLHAESDCLCMLLGGAALDGPRHLYWNFVSSRPERIEQAKADWKAGRFPKVVGDDEFIPLPD